jgi:3-oxoacyl-[acyl-carrier protein] reductase
MKLDNKIAVLTGAGGAFGEATASLFAKEGANLILTDYNLDAIKPLALELKSKGSNVVSLKVDVSNESDVIGMRKRVEEEFGKVDILVNIAGISRSADIQDISLEEWHKLIEINLTGSFLCCRELIDGMIEKKAGKIVNVASISAQTARPVAVDYSASKSGILGLTRTLALQVAPYGINVNAIAPGPVVTPLFEKNFPKGVVDKLLSTIPFRRKGTPEDIANLILFLSSSDSDWITGEVVAINGGAFIG